jgi:hypothetical protein
MRVAISYAVEIDDDIRRAIRKWYGREGLASRDEVKRWYESYGKSSDDDLAWSVNPDNPDTEGARAAREREADDA